MNNHIRSRQLNPCDELFWKSRRFKQRPKNWRDNWEAEKMRQEHIHKSNANNPNNHLFWKIKGFSERPHEWRRDIVRNGFPIRRLTNQPLKYV